MTDVDQGRSRSAADLLLEVAGPRLYLTNPFRVTGLTTDAGAREVRQRRQTVLNAIELGATSSVNDKRLPLPTPPEAADVRAAFDALERPDRRLVDELFWWWGEPGKCGCAKEVHEAHDLAVEAHAKALDAEDRGEVARADRVDLWTDAADAWMDALDYDTFWDHVRARVTALSDRRLDESTVDGLRSTMEGALLQPIAALVRQSPKQADLVRMIDVWDIDTNVIDDARAYAAAPVYERIDAQVKDIVAMRDREEIFPAAQRAMDELPEAAELLETLVPHERFRRAAKLRNQMGITMNNCAFAMVPPLTDAQNQLKTALYEHALDLIVEETDHEITADNLKTHKAALAAPTPASTTTRTSSTYRTSTPGVGVDKGELWRRITEAINARRFDDALALLRQLEQQAATAQDRADIAYVRRNILTAQTGQAQQQLPAPRTWFMNLAMSLGLIAGVLALMMGEWGAAPFWAVLFTVVLAPIPLTISYIERYRAVGGWLAFVGFIAFFFAILGFLQTADVFGAAAWWSLGLFVVTLPFTSAIGKSLTERWGWR
ncbi:hypothetical protein GCM10029964_073440 [Kibdelosporangium lantanae]